MLVKKYLTEVASITNPVDSLYLLELKSKDKPFRFLPGQFLHLALDEYDPSQGWPESRCFSIQAQNGPDLIVLSFSAKGRFTKRMALELAPGRTVSVKLPFGSLFNDVSPDRRCVFIAGGTGLTPFLSLFTDNSFEHYKDPMLYAGFRNSNYNLYDDYLSRAKTINSGFNYKIKYEDAGGILDIAEIFAGEQPDSLYFLSGPPRMITNFRHNLEQAGIDKANIRTDDWE